MADNPYLSLQRFNGDGVQIDWTVSFAGNRPDAASGTTPYLSASDVEAYEVIPATAVSAEVRIDRTVTVIGPSQFRVTPAVAAGRVLVIRRRTEDRYPLVDFNSLQAVSEFDLDQSNRQSLFLTQEAVDQARLAEDVAKDAEQIAYSSVADSIEALSTANSALTASASATSTANNASSAAAAAVNTANTANTTASQANTTAATAYNTAVTATNTANAAASAAATATATANAATSTANGAVATANGAVNTALAAVATADDAFDAANLAQAAAASAQQSASNTEQLAITANANASQALSTANAIDGKATDALAASADAVATADQAMQLITDAGVSTFNGRAGVVTPLAGDYTAAQVSYGTGTVADELEALDAYDVILTAQLNSEINRISSEFNTNLTASLAGKLNVNGVAVDSQKLGGQNITYFATAAALTAGLATKLDSGAQAVSAATATKLTTARAINGVNFDGTNNITVADGTKLPLTGGRVTGEIQLGSHTSNWVGLDMDQAKAYSLRIHSPGVAYTWIGARNASYTHYQSGTGQHYFYGQVVAEGNIVAYSDIRVKTNIEPIRNGLDKVALLGGYTYDRTDMESPRQAGVIAQQVQKVLPEAVMTDPETGHLFVNYNSVVALLVEAVNDLREKVRRLENGAS